MGSSARKLEYAERKYFARRGRAKTLIFCSALLALLIAAGTHKRQLQSLAPKLRLIYLERRCMYYSQDPSQVVYEEDPIAAGRLLNLEGYHKLIWDNDPSAPVAGFVPEQWAAYAPYADRWRYGLDVPRANLFLHQLITKSGQRRLVADDAVIDRGSHPELRFHTYIFTISGLRPTAESIRHMSGTIPALTNRLPGAKNVRIYAGKLDQNDPSKFRYNYEIDGKQGWAEVTLIDIPPGEDDTTRVEMVYTLSPTR